MPPSRSERDKRKRLFISFAIEDKVYRNYLKAQARLDRSPFDFIDMSVKEPWKQSVGRQKCRTKIKACDGVVVLLSSKTYHSGGARWEIRCAKKKIFQSLESISKRMTRQPSYLSWGDRG
jgi:hypothetical protein